MIDRMPGWIEVFGLRLEGLSKPTKRMIAIAADASAIPALLAVAFVLKSDSLGYALRMPGSLYVLAIVSGTSVFIALGLYREVLKYISIKGLVVGWAGVILATSLLIVVNETMLHAPVQWSVWVMYCAMALIYVAASRLLLRLILHYRCSGAERRPVVVYGAGSAGVQLAGTLRDDRNYRPVAFLDDNPALHGRIISGLKVCAPDHLSRLIARERVSSVLLALPSQSRRQRKATLKWLEQFAIHVQTIPHLGDILAGRASVSDIRDVDANELLGRDPVAPYELLLDGCIRGKSVMVTGAGGSIGSELCRQIIRLQPHRLLLLEMSEPALYQIERELRLVAHAEGVNVELVALLGNTRHRLRMRDIMRSYAVQTVYHAAAYKHVPIVEQNVIEGIHNNIFSSWNAAEAALESNVETFVLISTDKAVNPTNVMGATKRFAELTLQALQERSVLTRFCMVRFGNVLESSGSVVPLFREQIRNGGPVTVTHKDVTRYFMTIPEASQLVLQAGSMARGGDVFVLDMSEPVRIEDLARRMINLMGFTVRDSDNPDGDIEISYTGLRPAEKLFEELLIGSNVARTEHPMIMRACEHYLPWSELKNVMDEMLEALDVFDCERARELLMGAVEEYRPGPALQDLVWTCSQQRSAGRGKVTELSSRRLAQLRQTH